MKKIIFLFLAAITILSIYQTGIQDPITTPLALQCSLNGVNTLCD